MASMAVEPLVLLANADKWLTESIESVLTQGGYRVITTNKRQQVLELARRQQPDAILVDLGLDQRASDNLTLCRALRADGMVSRATPIVLMNSSTGMPLSACTFLKTSSASCGFCCGAAWPIAR